LVEFRVVGGVKSALAFVKYNPLCLCLSEQHAGLCTPFVKQTEEEDQHCIVERGTGESGAARGCADPVDKRVHLRLDNHVISVEDTLEARAPASNTPGNRVNEDVEQERAEHGALRYTETQCKPSRALIAINSADTSAGKKGCDPTPRPARDARLLHTLEELGMPHTVERFL
jgi:hypothetical protein